MDVSADLRASCDAEGLYRWVEDLAAYPRWLDIVRRVVPDGAAGGDPGPAWLVDLVGRWGPFARAKRLRMVRTVHEPPHRVRFERRETDGRHHSPWVLDATVAASDDGTSTLRMHLHYGGSLWGPVLERLLADAINRARPALAALAES